MTPLASSPRSAGVRIAPGSMFHGLPGVAALAIASLSAVPSVAQAQRERAVVRLETFGGAAVEAPDGTVRREPYAQQSLQVNVAHRLVRGQGSTILVLGAQYRGVRAALPRREASLANNTLEAFADLTVATADLMLLRTLNDRHTLVAAVRPGVYGDLSGGDGQVRAEGAVFVDRLLSPRTTIGVGLSYASNFGKLLPIPVVHVVARPKRQVLVDALLPARADVWWMPRKGLDVGLGAGLVGAQYAIGERLRVGNADQLWLANATVGPQLKWAPRGGKLQLTADAGVTVLRRLEYTRDGERVADLAPGNAGFGRLGAQWLF